MPHGLNWYNMLPQVRGKEPFETTCPNCKERVITVPDEKSCDFRKQRTVGKAICNFLLSLAFCCCIPFICNGERVVHYCPGCKLPIAKFDWCFENCN